MAIAEVWWISFKEVDIEVAEAEVVKLLRSEVEEDVNEPQNTFEDSYLYIEAQKILFLIISIKMQGPVTS